MITRFPTIRLEGGLISSDQIDRIADQKVKEFSIDDIAAAWSDIRSYWTLFQNSLAKLPENDLGTSITRNRWMMPFFSTLGYDLSSPKVAAEVDGQTYAISHRAGKNDNSPPIHIVGIRQSLDRRPESGRPRLAPHSLVQEYLNRTEHLWGIVTNGSSLRILRDSHLMRKQAYIEFDLEQMMKDEIFADFALLFRLIHASRLPKSDEDASSCLLEQYHKQTIEQGGRVRDHLRGGVEKALIQFANGFLSHPCNTALRANVQDKSLEPFEYYQQLLRLIYRFLFLMVSEERNLITDNMLYREHYSISRIRRFAEIRAAYTCQEDLWLGLVTSFKFFQDEELGSLLAVPTLNGDLFDPLRTSEINDTSLSNRDLLTAMWDICMYREKDTSPWRRINYAALDVEELGSVYESLLDFQPVFVQQKGKTKFQLLAGTERKSTGSFYTPPELVNELIQSALVPTIKDRLSGAKTGDEKAAALLAMTVCDPACGSGHFLLAASRSIGRELAKARTGDEEPAPEQMRSAIRDVITHCIYGVDKNPLAVDLCKVALWLEGHTKGKPLTFLDHRVRCGDSLVGVVDLKVLNEGIPDEAYNAVKGDDKPISKELKKQNKNERLHKSLTSFDASIQTLTESRKQLIEISDDTPEQIRHKAIVFRSIQQEGSLWCKDKTVCDLWTSAFFVKIVKENLHNQTIPTTDTIRSYFNGSTDEINAQLDYSRTIAKKHHFFHWKLEFPEVFAKGGFDCLLGNPPWGKIKLLEQQFFSQRDISIARAPNKAAREKLISKISRENATLANEFLDTKHSFDKYNSYIRESSKFPLTSKGDINTYLLFTDICIKLVNKFGHCGLLIPTGIATDETTKDFFKELIQEENLISIFGFSNWNFIFPEVGDRFTFCLLTLGGQKIKCKDPKYIFLAHSINDLKNPIRLFKLTKEDIELINPNTNSCPVFRTSIDVELTKKLYRNNEILIRDHGDVNPYQLKFFSMFHMANDSHLFSNSNSEDNLPLYEGKMFEQYNHRFGYYTEEMLKSGQTNFKIIPHSSEKQLMDFGYTVNPRYYVSKNDVLARINGYWKKKWFLCFRQITLSVNERTSIASILPASGIGHTIGILLFNSSINAIFISLFLANFNTLTFDYISRQKIGSTSFGLFILKQLPPISKSIYTEDDFKFITPRVLELTYTAWDIKAYADDVWHDADDVLKALIRQQHEANRIANVEQEWKLPVMVMETADDGIPLPPFTWDEERRAILRAELDAWYAKLYGLSRDELQYILDPVDIYGTEFPGETFRVLKEKEMKKYGEYRTRRLVLKAWDSQ